MNAKYYLSRNGEITWKPTDEPSDLEKLEERVAKLEEKINSPVRFGSGGS